MFRKQIKLLNILNYFNIFFAFFFGLRSKVTFSGQNTYPFTLGFKTSELTFNPLRMMLNAPFTSAFIIVLQPFILYSHHFTL